MKNCGTITSGSWNPFVDYLLPEFRGQKLVSVTPFPYKQIFPYFARFPGITNSVMLSPELVIDQTKKWILDVVIGCQFCPFAAREYLSHRIHYQVYDGLEKKRGLDGLLDECRRLDTNANISTTLLIFPNAFGNFSEYLDFVYQAEKLLQAHSYTGQYQLASFHPDYRFAKSKLRDAANYTNRSIYPMLHILREDSLSEALAAFPHPEEIPRRNQQFARSKGVDFMVRLRESCK